MEIFSDMLLTNTAGQRMICTDVEHMRLPVESRKLEAVQMRDVTVLQSSRVWYGKLRVDTGI
jgi:hypothetical protein